jgi:hypothetical protein
MDLYKILKQAYHFGRDNGSGRSEKNLNDFIQKPEIKQLLIDGVVGQSEQLFALLKYTMPEQFTDLALKNIVKGFIEKSK